MRWSAAGRQPVIPGGKHRRSERRQVEKENGHERELGHHTHRAGQVPLREQRDHAMVIRRGGISVDGFVQRSRAGENLESEEENQTKKRAAPT